MNSTFSDVLYVAGIAPRSGNGYVYRLISDHPSCLAAAGGEDYFLLKSDLLHLFSESIYTKWKSDWGFKQNNASEHVLSALGDGLIQFLRSQCTNEDDYQDRPVVTVTPHVDNIHRFPRLFPEGYLIILIRDGRAVTESSIRTFDLTFDQAARTWRKGARQVLSFLDVHGSSSEWHEVIHYEDVVRHTGRELSKLFQRVGLDPDVYPYEKLDDVPVVGSSTYGQEKGRITWEEKDVDDSFDPTQRFSNWGKRRHERFDWIAGEELRALGYISDTTSGTSFRANVRNRLNDLKSMPTASIETAKGYAKQAVYSYILR
jgi:protein-tyrosine sulfotransferase